MNTILNDSSIAEFDGDDVRRTARTFEYSLHRRGDGSVLIVIEEPNGRHYRAAVARGTAGGWERDEEVADGVCLSDDYADSVAAGFEAAFGPGAGVLGVAAVVVYGTADDDSDPGYLRVEVTTATEPADTIEAWFSRCGQPVLDLWESLTDPAGQRYLYAAAQPGR